jgi:hypothetical protein
MRFHALRPKTHLALRLAEAYRKAGNLKKAEEYHARLSPWVTKMKMQKSLQ